MNLPRPREDGAHPLALLICRRAALAGYNPVCKVTPVFLHGVVSPDQIWGITPCRMTGVSIHSSTILGLARFSCAAARSLEVYPSLDGGMARAG